MRGFGCLEFGWMKGYTTFAFPVRVHMRCVDHEIVFIYLYSTSISA
jgi:hypothetical protein